MIKKILGFLPVIISSCSSILPLEAAIELPSIFSDHMVLQRDKPIPIWGWSDEGQEVKVSFGGNSARAMVGEDGRWQVDLPPMSANAQGRTLTIEGDLKIVITDVLVGEVWVCSGQSNMEWSVNGALNPNEERQAADHPIIRHIKVPKVPSDSHERNFDANWQVCSPATAGVFTAVGYYFGRTLKQELDVPIGLINSSWGGTRIEPWMPIEGYRIITNQGFAQEVIRRVDAVDPATEEGKARHLAGIQSMRDWVEQAEKAVHAGKFPPNRPATAQVGIGTSHQDPTRLYRGMIHPLVPYAIRGAIWYQGESNGNEGETYYHKKHGLVKGWRKVWNQGDFPFYWVQLANFTNDKKTPQGGDGYAQIRDAERKALDIPNSGMAVIIDIG
jgi:sialate O-acetylesterase